MRRVYDQEEIPLELLRRPRRHRSFEEETELSEPQPMDELPGPVDRFRAGTSGAIMGLLAGAAALGVFHLMMRPFFVALVARTATHRAVPFEAAMAIAYVSLASAGALLGACFASVTKYLRRWLPLTIWSLVFFGSVAMIVLAAARTWLHGPTDPMMRAIFAATGVYAFLIPFSLGLRKRRA